MRVGLKVRMFCSLERWTCFREDNVLTDEEEKAFDGFVCDIKHARKNMADNDEESANRDHIVRMRGI